MSKAKEFLDKLNESDLPSKIAQRGQFPLSIMNTLKKGDIIDYWDPEEGSSKEQFKVSSLKSGSVKLKNLKIKKTHEYRGIRG